MYVLKVQTKDASTEGLEGHMERDPAEVQISNNILLLDKLTLRVLILTRQLFWGVISYKDCKHYKYVFT